MEKPRQKSSVSFIKKIYSDKNPRQLGFDNPHCFSALYKKETGLTPVEYKDQFLN
jgi:YesN/AraC family two-component response regulator